MIDTPTFVTTTAQRTAVIRLEIPRSEIQRVMGPGLAELHAALGAQGLTPTGPWFSHHFRMRPDVFEFEIGMPIDASVKPVGRVIPSELPAVAAARTILHGGYENLAGAWPKLDAWIVAQGKKPGPALRETYLVGPDADPDPRAWRTELTRPLAT